MKVIEERKAEMLARRIGGNSNSEENEIGLKKRKPFLDLLLETHLKNPESFPLKGVQEEVDTFMFEGHDTTAMGE